MKMLRDDDAVNALLDHREDIDYLVGPTERKLYIRMIKAGLLHLLAIDERSIMAFHDEGDTMHIDIVTGAPGTITRVSELLDAAKAIGYKRIVARTKNAGMRRVYRRHGMADAGFTNGEYKLQLELNNG